ncbi:hypothetical protein [Pseudomonas sp. Ga0074129]|uniref:hypothetical protein n=1 Tax=Pseudomonas sp. Ga0074129 TaxID=1752219 RepID=UPI000B315DFC|nr:hypothetical protein [Pseudomonas sp. Ga0074129]
MNLLSKLVSLFTSIVQPVKPAYTTIIYPIQGKAVVVHDSLGIRHEPRWQHSLEPLLQEVGGTSSAFGSLSADNPFWNDSAIDLEVGNSLSNLSADDSAMSDSIQWVNPANGLPSFDGCIDIMGNPMGMDSTFDDCWSAYSGCSSFDFV